MSRFFSSSIGKKLIMSITGLFLILFLAVHLSINLLLLVGDGEVFNRAANFMATNPALKAMEFVLAAGFIIHIIYSIVLTLQNQMARPIKYKVVNQKGVSPWASRNMLMLGNIMSIFLVVHIINFFWKLKFGEVPAITYDGEEMHDTYTLVTSLFMNWWWYDAIYIAGAILLGYHLSHGFWSAFQTIGLDNDVWRPRLEMISKIYAFIIGAGFTIIPLFFFIKAQLS